MVTRYIGSLAFTLLLIVGVFSVSNGFCSDRSALVTLETTLNSLDLVHPERDMEKNVSLGDFHFIGINGYTCEIPESKDYSDTLIKRYGLRCLAGTSDMIEGEEHAKLIKKADEYAVSYNKALKRWLNDHKTP
jgi:outer membrane lipoprotein LolB